MYIKIIMDELLVINVPLNPNCDLNAFSTPNIFFVFILLLLTDCLHKVFLKWNKFKLFTLQHSVFMYILDSIKSITIYFILLKNNLNNCALTILISSEPSSNLCVLLCFPYFFFPCKFCVNNYKIS